MINNTPQLGYYFNGRVKEETQAMIKWFDANVDTCFFHIKNASEALRHKQYAIQHLMWKELYPEKIIADLRSNEK